MLKLSKKDSYDLLILIIIVVIVLIAGHRGFFDNLHHFTGITFTLAIFGLPTLYLLFRKPENIQKALWAGFLFGILFGIPFEFMAMYSKAWIINPSYLLFSGTIFGVVSLDEVIWYFLWTAFAITFYEHFIEHDKKWTVSPHIYKGILFALFMNMIVFSIFHFAPQFLLIRHAYFILGICAIVPMFWLLNIHPKLFLKFVPITLFFAPIYLGHDIVAIEKGWWSFTGTYVFGGLNIMGHLLPLEEILFWIVLGSAVMASYHEIFLDDRK